MPVSLLWSEKTTVAVEISYEVVRALNSLFGALILTLNVSYTLILVVLIDLGSNLYIRLTEFTGGLFLL
jgi:hypothetical protein